MHVRKANSSEATPESWQNVNRGNKNEEEKGIIETVTEACTINFTV